MMLRKSIFVAAALAGFVAAACGQHSAPQITTSDVVDGLREKGITINAAQVTLLISIPVRTEHPGLEAMKIEPFLNGTSRVLLRCADRTSCIPFYAVVSGLERNEERPRTTLTLAKPAVQKAALVPMLLRKGASATLQIVSEDMLITIPVICMQSGRQGDTIKVSSPDRQITYMGEIINSGLLRSHL
jgi:hypothetical protein